MRFEEPVGVFVPDGLIENFNGFGKTIVFEVLFDLTDTIADLATNPVFAHVICGVRV